MAEFKSTASQQAAIDTRGCPVLVSAGAGSGKTRVLTERLMARITDIRSPADIDSFLIITYTRAAAGELRGRITEELHRRLAADPHNACLRRQSALIRRAQIGTIHSFCADLLRENCQAAKLSPDFKILDEERADAMRQACLEHVLEDAYADLENDPDFQLLADTVGEGRDDSALAALILELHTKMQCHAFPADWARAQIDALQETHADAGDTIWGRELLSRVSRLAEHWSCELDALIAAMRDWPEIRAAYAEHYEGIAAQVREIGRTVPLGWDRVAALVPLVVPRLPRLSKSPNEELSEYLKKRRTACIEDFKALAKIFASSSETLLRDMALTAPAMRALLNLTLDFDRAYARDKQSRGLADYSDLEHRAAALLMTPDGTPTALAQRLSARYTEVMVDEYQDVSRVQDAIFSAVSDGGKRLFLVGDVKQSIYRFRLADPAIFNEKYRAYAEPDSGARRILLRENFRSRKEVIDAANAVFRCCMSETLGDVDYDADAALVHGAVYYEGEVPKPELLLYELPENDPEESPDKLALEAAFTARQIRALVQSGAAVTDGSGTRPMDYGDIAILLRSPNKTGGVYREALMNLGIPVGSAQGSGFFETPEVSLVLSMLTVMDNPHKDIPLIAVLRSAAFGFTPDELSFIRTANRDADFFTALEAAGESDDKCRAFLTLLTALRAEAIDLSAAETVWLVIEKLDLLALCSAMDDGARRRENLMALSELAESFESTGYRGLHRLSLWLQALAGRGQEPNIAPGTGRAVQIISIHRSKGLEYPVVFLCDAARRFNTRDRSVTVLVHPELGLGPRVVDLQNRVRYPSLARLAISSRQAREDQSEEMRLLYVALTRAKERLFVVGSCKSAEKALEKAAALAHPPIAPETLMGATNYLTWLLCACLADGEEHFKIRVCRDREEELPAADTVRERIPADPEAVQELTRRLAFVYPHRAAVELPSKVTATELKGRYVRDPDAQNLLKPKSYSFRMPVLGEGERSLTATEKGVATHLVLQYMDFARAASRAGIKAEVERLCAARFLSKREAEAVNVAAIERLFRSELGKRMLRAEKPLREFRFSLLLDAERLYPGAEGEQLLLQGVVDCCLEEDGQLVIIDYKTDNVRTEEQIEERAALYRGQLAAYAEALTRIFKKPVKEGLLFFLAPGREVRVI